MQEKSNRYKIINHMVEILNKKNKKVQALNDIRSATVTINPVKGCISFNSATVEIAHLIIGKYVHLVRMDKVWCFMVNDDSSGYKLWKPDPKAGFLYISSKPLVRYFVECTGIKTLTRFYVQETGSSQNGNNLFEILVHMPLKAFTN